MNTNPRLKELRERNREVRDKLTALEREQSFIRDEAFDIILDELIEKTALDPSPHRVEWLKQEAMAWAKRKIKHQNRYCKPQVIHLSGGASTLPFDKSQDFWNERV